MVNIKISVKLSSINYKKIITEVKKLNIKEKNNFVVVFHTYTYTIFKPSLRSGNLHCNITKIKDFFEIPIAIEFLRELLSGVKIENINIDNITSKADQIKKQNLNTVFLTLSSSYEIKYNLQKFPAIFVKVPVEHGTATVLIFSSGKIICVGAKSLNDVKIVSRWIERNFDKPQV